MRRLLAALALVVAIAPVAWLTQRLTEMRVTASSDALLLESDPALSLYNATRQTFGTDEYVILAAEVEDPLSDEAIDLLIDMEEQLEKCPQVATVLSILNAPLLRSRPGGPDPSAPTYIANYDEPETAEADLDLARAELHGHEFYEKLLISADWRVVGTFAYLYVPDELDRLYAERGRLRRELERAAAVTADERAAMVARLAQVEADYAAMHADLEVSRRDLVYALRGVVERLSATHGLTVHMAGVPVINVNMADYVRHDLLVFGLVSLGMAFATLVLLLGGRSPLLGLARSLLVIVSAAVPVLATLIAMVLFDVPMTVVTCNLPSLLFVLSLAHGIHLIERWRRVGAQEGVRGVARNLLAPCVLTATTTMAGFLSLIVTDLRPVIDFGTFMSVGVGLAVLSAFWIVGAGLAIVGMRRQGAQAAAGDEGDTVIGPAETEDLGRGPAGAILGGLASLSLRHGRGVIAVAVVLLVASLAGASRLTAETRFSDYFRDSSEIVVGLEYIDQNLVGITTLEVVMTAPEGKSFLSAWGVETIERVEAAASQLPALSRVESLAAIYREFTKALPSVVALSADQVLPVIMTIEAAQTVVSGYVTEDGSEALVKIRLQETHPDLDRQATREQLEELLAADAALAEARPQATGIFVLHGNLLGSLIGNQLRSFAYVSLAILVMFLVIFRSLSASLVGLVPNVLPVVFVLGVMGSAGIALDLVTVMIASVAMGIGVDAAIHYLFAYRAGVRRGSTPAEAIRHAHLTVGRPILFAATTVVAAFGVLVLSEFVPSIYFGLFTALTMLVALLGTLTLIPALLVRLRPFR